MEIDLALLADAATVDAAGKLNILGVFDRITTSGFPARHPQIALVLRFVASFADRGRHTVEIRLKDEEGAEVMGVNGEIHVGASGPDPAARIRIPQVVNLGNLVFPKPGRYAFDVSVDGIHQVSIPLTLDVMAPQGPIALA